MGDLSQSNERPSVSELSRKAQTLRVSHWIVRDPVTASTCFQCGAMLRSIYDGQWWDLIHHTPAWRSTSAGTCSAKTGWSHQSTRSTSSLGVPPLSIVNASEHCSTLKTS